MEVAVRRIAPESLGWSITISILMIVLGVIALAVPFIAGLAVEIWVSWLFLLGGVAHLIFAFHVRGAGAHIWEALVGLAYILFSFFLFFHPLTGLVSITLFLGLYLIAKACFELFAGFTLGGLIGRGWLFVDAAVSLFLAALIWMHLPSAATWVIGTLLGVSILFTGISRLGLAFATRRAGLAYT